MSGALEGTKLTMGNIKKNHLVSEIASPRKRLSPKMMTGIKGATPNNPIKLDQSIIKEADSHLDKTDSFGGRLSHLNLTNVIKGSSHDLGTKGSNFDVL